MLERISPAFVAAGRAIMVGWLFGWCWSVGAGAAFAAESETSDRYAFLVGINDYSSYEDDGLDNLSFCVADMQSFEEKLDEIGFKRVYCLTTKSTTSWQPTKSRIEYRFNDLLNDEDVGAEDFVLVALSGHGLERAGVSGGSTAYFCPADAHSEREETMLPVMWFYEQLNESKAGMKLLIVDACRNLARPRASGTKPELSSAARGFMRSLSKTAPPRGIAALLSCQSGQYSHEVPELGHGVFMHHVLEGLSGQADVTAGNRDGSVSLPELFNYASDQTEAYVDTEAPVKYSDQTPILRGDLPNYKIVRVRNAPDLMVRDKIELSFTVTQESTREGDPISGAEVSVLYRATPRDPRVALETSECGADGRCVVKLPRYMSVAQGEFTALVSHEAVSKRFPLTRIAHGRSWTFEIPHELPEEIENSIGMTLKLIPAGEFLMGSPEDEDDRDDDEGPQHRVRLTQPFYLGETEVTQGQWEAVMGSQPWSDETYAEEGSDYAASYISWDEAVAFCKRLSEKEGRTYRLPTEAEWEYACRAGTETAYSFGDDRSELDEYAWFEDNAGDVDERYAHEVGRKRANDFGLYDMHGNVCEWCADWYGSEYYGDSPTEDPSGPTSGSRRVYRGGCWGLSARICRSAIRGGSSPGARYGSYGGFRVALVAAE